MLSAALTGFFTGLSLIMAIGSQNAFVLRQGLARSHVFPLVLFCAISDALLIAAGVLGFSALVKAVPWFPVVMKWAGVAFLVFYGVQRFLASWRGGAVWDEGARRASLGAVLLLAAAFTWLNPHVYLDTLVLIGAISTSYVEGAERLSFGAGAIAASFAFFFALGFGARYLAPIMASARAWQILDFAIGLLMFALAAKLAWG